MTKSKFNQDELFKQGLRGCNKCGDIKSVEQFTKCSKVKSGLVTRCKSCTKIYNIENRDVLLTQMSNWRDKNATKIKDNNLKYKHRYKGKYKETEKEWRKNNPDKRHKPSAEAIKKSNQKIIKELGINYVKTCIHQQYMIPRESIPPKLIELKRTELQIRRTRKQIINQIKNQNHDK